MGFISRRVIPVCAPLCCCFCPALRSRSHKPIKRYTLFLSEIFKSADAGIVNDKNLGKLAEYAEENPDRIPNIAAKLEERGLKGLSSHSGGLTPVEAVVKAFARLMAQCGTHMALLALPVTNLCQKLMDSQELELRTLGCQLATDFFCKQVDTSFASAADALLPRILKLAQGLGAPPENTGLCRAAALQALRAYICFTAHFGRALPEESWQQVSSAVLGSYEQPQSKGEQGSPGPEEKQSKVAVARNKLHEAREAARDKKREGTATWDSTFSFLSKDMEQVPEVVSLTCAWSLALLASTGPSASPLFSTALNAFVAHISSASLWGSGLALSFLQDLSSALGLVGAGTGQEWQTQFLLVECLVILLASQDSANTSSSPGPLKDAFSALLKLLKELDHPPRHPSGAGRPDPNKLHAGAGAWLRPNSAGTGSRSALLGRSTTFNSGYAAGEVSCVQILTSFLARQNLAATHEGQQRGKGEVPREGEGGGASGRGEQRQGGSVGGMGRGGGEYGSLEDLVVGCVAELGRIIGTPAEYLDALGLAVEGIPATSVDETKGTLAVLSLVAPAGLNRLSQAGQSDGAELSVAENDGDNGEATKLGGKRETQQTVTCPQLIFTALLQAMMHPDASVRLEAHTVLGSFINAAPASASPTAAAATAAATTATAQSSRVSSNLLSISQEQAQLLMSALWLEATECTESLTSPSFVSMLSTFKIAASAGGMQQGSAGSNLGPAARLAFSLRAKVGPQEVHMNASCQRSLLTLTTAMLLFLTSQTQGTEERHQSVSLLLELTPEDPFLQVSSSGELSEKLPGGLDFGSADDRARAAQVLAALRPSERKAQLHQKLARALAGDGELAEFLEDFEVDPGVVAVRSSYLVAATDGAPSASPSLLLGLVPLADNGEGGDSAMANGEAGDEGAWSKGESSKQGEQAGGLVPDASNSLPAGVVHTPSALPPEAQSMSQGEKTGTSAEKSPGESSQDAVAEALRILNGGP